jgi:hypothetical protein
MLGALAALLLTGDAIGAAGGLDSGQLPQLFVAACLDGQARLTPGGAVAISFDALPSTLRQRLGEPLSAQVWRLRGGSTFLYVLSYQPAQEANPHICGLASDEMNYDEAASAVDRRVTGMPASDALMGRNSGSVQWTDPNGDYTALVTKAGAFNVVQINWLSDAQRAAVLKEINHVTP